LIVDGRPSLGAAMVAERFARGDRCFVAVDSEGRVAHCRWVATAAAEIPELDMELVLWPGEAYFYDGYTRPDARGRGVDAAVRTHIFRWLRSAGYKRAYSYVRGDNPVGLRAAARLQRSVGKVAYFKPRGGRTVVFGDRRPALPLLLPRSFSPSERTERQLRAEKSRAWFQDWLNRPLPQRSTGFHAMPPEYFRATADFISTALDLDPAKDVVLDVGCDSAMVSRFVAPRCAAFAGTDFMPGLLIDAPRGAVATAAGRPGAFAAADGRSLPYRSETFSKAYCCAVIHVLAGREDGIRMINEIVRVCRPGGQVLIASVPDTAKGAAAFGELWQTAGVVEKMRLLAAHALPEHARKVLRRLTGISRRDPIVLLEYDLKRLKSALTAHALDCRIVDFPDSYPSRDFRRTRSSLLISVPAEAAVPAPARAAEKARAWTYGAWAPLIDELADQISFMLTSLMWT
ncbi:MAG TPA: methyltransferase domain-containing protein, partial [Candidatus Binatia bacterium]|nr:methyltransferase domain-containing protein [Candidatus Binatia bacterium]